VRAAATNARGGTPQSVEQADLALIDRHTAASGHAAYFMAN
jgi:hypothetical protein